MRTLSLDPGGTTGIYWTDGEQQEEFYQITNQNWKEHYVTISQLIQTKQPNLLLFEDTNYIGQRTKEGLSLFRLLGALEVLTVERIEKVNVIKVKELTKKLYQGVKKLEGLEYLPGRGKGWMFKGQRVSIHCLEAYLVAWLFKNG